ncbi:MAG: lipid asymmetry maintenance ABC transporter permease subunit MlaE [Gammaproteobacteria bacterium]|nr:lipid asymmetry maintenance ABC transporter permease subunit MlaE [Gammaproteobacteria bacterium]
MTKANLLLRRLTQAIRKLGAVTLFFVGMLQALPYAVRRPALVSRQVHNAGVLSLVIIMTSGFFVGMVIGLQGYDAFSRLRQEDLLGAGAALTLLKELGPVVTALLFAGRAGTALTAEIGLMRATDQISAMEVMAIDPMGRIAVPRFLGGVISVPLLTAIFNSVGILGAWFVGVQLMGVDNGAFWSQMQEYVETGDVNEGILKSVVFGVAASLVAVFEGYTAEPTAEGVGLATTRTVVITSVLVLILDYMITAFLL